ncbi:DUF4246 domain-containing protein [Phanerochaete sordida]|uniref:DUF4246 domain-containing protein n=1 Tax=Phanerochaete sordida TaxID=48140 RepID=A0A9P3GQG5_9APHY|nr:DUF4246 domain-containing protein [Phanerochaete sordida]
MVIYQPDDTDTLRMGHVYRHPFGCRFGPYSDPPLLANERNMCALSATLRAKPHWWIKMQDPAIRAKWLEEAVGAPPPYGEIFLTRDEVLYVLKELEWYASRRDESTGIESSVYYRIWQSDSLVDGALRAELMKHVAVLEDVPDEAKDWHPGSDGQVLDLVHPSLYCIVYGRTFVYDSYDPRGQHVPPDLPRYAYDPETYVEVDHGWTEYFLSRRFSWLPTDFAISTDGSAKALGYINNLNPYTHDGMYPVIEKLVARFVPLWERVLAETRVENQPPCRVQTNEYEWVPKDSGGNNDGDAGNDQWWNHDNDVLRLPPVLTEFTPDIEPDPVNLKGRTLQVIIKLANIHLTPEKPRYPGGAWHVEGMINESIISTGLYYYDEENITQSSLAFRMAVNEPSYILQDDEDASQAIYGFGRHEPLNQVVGAVATTQGRCVAFPNYYQHQVQPFELTDASKPGHRKILALFLVDPSLSKPRPSTSSVPPQQPDVLRFVLRGVAADMPIDEHGLRPALGRLPVELLDLVAEQGDAVMMRAEAEAVRLELMDERRGMVMKNDEKMFAHEYNMCEH